MFNFYPESNSNWRSIATLRDMNFEFVHLIPVYSMYFNIPRIFFSNWTHVTQFWPGVPKPHYTILHLYTFDQVRGVCVVV